jgi:Domain of unknown function (DUF4397)
MQSLFRLLGLFALALALWACDSGRKSPPKVTVIAVNAAPSYEQLAFLRAERIESTLAYRTGKTFSFDEDEYNFHVETTTPDGAARTRLLEVPQKISASTEYTFLLREIGGVLRADVLEAPVLTSGDSQIRAIHSASVLGPVDMYLAAAGTDLTTVAPFATLNLGDITPLTGVTPGSYELSLTEAGNAANVLLTTPAFSLSTATSASFTITDGAGQGLAPYGIIASSIGGVANLIDKNTGSELRVISAVSDRNGIEVTVDGQLFLADAPFATISAYQPLTPGDHTLIVRPANDPNATSLIPGQVFTLGSDARYTFLIGGDPASVGAFESIDDRRPVPDRAHLRYFNGSTTYTAVDYFVVAPGTDVTSAAFSVISPATTPQNLSFAPGDYEIVLRENGTSTILAGPTPITLAAGGVYSILAVDSLAGGSLDVVPFDDFN